MPAATVAPIEPLGVARVALSQGAGERIGLIGDRHQMDVIRHQAIAEQRHAVPPRPLTNSVEIEAAIVVQQEDVLAALSS